MQVTKKIVLSLTVLFTSYISQPAEAEEFAPDETVVIDTAITSSSMAPIFQSMMATIQKDKTPVNFNIVLASPGGSVFVGTQFISLMKELKNRGTHINCYVAGIAASMAFQILVECNNRQVLSDSFLLWHRARISVGGGMFSPGVAVTSVLAESWARDLGAVDSHILKSVVEVLGKGMSRQDIEYHFNNETLHRGDQLCEQVPHFCTAHDYIPGLLKALNNPKLIRTGSEDRKSLLKGGIIYIYTKFLQSIGSN